MSVDAQAPSQLPSRQRTKEATRWRGGVEAHAAPSGPEDRESEAEEEPQPAERDGLFKEHAPRAESVAGPDDRRIEWGHALIGIAVLVRRACAPLALVALAILLFAAVVPGLAGLGAAWTLAVAAAVFVAGRTFAVGLAALGWMVFPPEHRALLAELAARAREHE